LTSTPPPLPSPLRNREIKLFVTPPLPEARPDWGYSQGKMIRKHVPRDENYDVIAEGICTALSLKWILLILGMAFPGSQSASLTREQIMKNPDTVVECARVFLPFAQSSIGRERVATRFAIEEAFDLRKTESLRTGIESCLAQAPSFTNTQCYEIDIGWPDLNPAEVLDRTYHHSTAIAFFSVEGRGQVRYFDPNLGEFSNVDVIKNIIKSYSNIEYKSTLGDWKKILSTPDYPVKFMNILDTSESLFVSDRAKWFIAQVKAQKSLGYVTKSRQQYETWYRVTHL